MRSGGNRAIIAAAGARKTQEIIDSALADSDQRVLVTTYTSENLNQIRRRIEQAVGVVPEHVHLTGWFSFLLAHGVRPFQSAVFNEPNVVRGMNFKGRRPDRVGVKRPEVFFLDGRRAAYRDGVSHLACLADRESRGDVVRRIEAIYDHIYIDEVQDLVGHDLEFLDLLFRSSVSVTVVGDPRQSLIATNNSRKNLRYRGTKILDWLADRADYCAREERAVSHRCHQSICDFASRLFPDYEPIRSVSEEHSDHVGIHRLSAIDVDGYVTRHTAQILRHDKREDTFGLPAMNIRVSKGSTFDHVVIFTTRPMRLYLDREKPMRVPESLYVAVTRAKFSVAFVM